MPSELWALLDPAAAMIEEQLFAAVHEAPYGTKRTSCPTSRMSVVGGKADLVPSPADVAL